MQVTPTVHSDPQMRLDESLVIWTGATLRPRIPPSPRTSQAPTLIWIKSRVGSGG